MRGLRGLERGGRAPTIGQSRGLCTTGEGRRICRIPCSCSAGPKPGGRTGSHAAREAHQNSGTHCGELPSGGGGAARWLPWRHAVFVTRGVPARRHRHGEPAAVGSVHLAVATRAAASGEGGGAFQELQLSDREERR